MGDKLKNNNAYDIEIKNIKLILKEKLVLNNINFKITDSKNKYIIQGGNGVGKTTTLRLISGLYIARGASITINEKSVSYNKYIDTINELSYYVPAGNDHLFPRNKVRDIIKYFYYLHNGKNIDESIIDNDLVINSLLNSEYRHLSSGKKKFVELYLAFLINKNILILDEPFTFLDTENISWLEEKILNYENKIIMVSHSNCEYLIEKMGMISVELKGEEDDWYYL